MAPRLCFREVCHEPLRQMQHTMPNLEVTVRGFSPGVSVSRRPSRCPGEARAFSYVFISDRTPLGCEDAFAPQGLQAACVAAFATFAGSSTRIFSLLTCVTLAA
jgi:hypothetical protein